MKFLFPKDFTKKSRKRPKNCPAKLKCRCCVFTIDAAGAGFCSGIAKEMEPKWNMDIINLCVFYRNNKGGVGAGRWFLTPNESIQLGNILVSTGLFCFEHEEKYRGLLKVFQKKRLRQLEELSKKNKKEEAAKKKNKGGVKK